MCDVSLLNTDKDFILMKRLENSMKQLMEKYPNGCPDHVIAAALGLSEERVQVRYLEIIACLQRKMNV
jgi:hypothetical protein